MWDYFVSDDYFWAQSKSFLYVIYGLLFFIPHFVDNTKFIVDICDYSFYIIFVNITVQGFFAFL